MDKLIKGAVTAGADLGPAAVEVIEVKEAVQEVVAPPDNRVRDFGILVGVVVLAAVCAKLYKCSSKVK